MNQRQTQISDTENLHAMRRYGYERASGNGRYSVYVHPNFSHDTPDHNRPWELDHVGGTASKLSDERLFGTTGGKRDLTKFYEPQDVD